MCSAAVQAKGWTFYGQAGRRPEIAGGDFYSYEYWGGKQITGQWAVRAGRFFPAYGIRFADHTSYNRVNLGFDKYDQVFGAEVSHTTQKSLVQVSVGPGRAESVLNEPGDNPFTTSGRVQFDLNSRNVLVGSGIYRTESATRSEQRRGGAGVWIFAGLAGHHLDAGRRAISGTRPMEIPWSSSTKRRSRHFAESG